MFGRDHEEEILGRIRYAPKEKTSIVSVARGTRIEELAEQEKRTFTPSEEMLSNLFFVLPLGLCNEL